MLRASETSKFVRVEWLSMPSVEFGASLLSHPFEDIARSRDQRVPLDLLQLVKQLSREAVLFLVR
jgi:hypothetical protein